MTFSAFSNDTSSLSIDNLTFENQTDGMSIYGDLQILRDTQGLQQLEAIKTIIDDAIAQLQNDISLPEKLELGQNNQQIDNPFL